jgi:PAS domain S-box-containing protein
MCGKASRKAGKGVEMDANRKTILLVEDDCYIASAQATILKQDGFNVVTALTGEEAIEIFHKGKPIDLILMDIDLGVGMDGAEAGEIILRDHDIPLIFLSNHTEIEVVEKTDKISSYGYVVKNSGENVLFAAIKMAFKLNQAYKEIVNKTISLQDSETRYRRLFESAQDGIFILNADTGRIVDVNPYLMELIGYTYDELIGKFLWEISPFKDIAENQDKFQELKKLEYVHYEHLPLLNKNGITINVEFVSNVYLVNGEKVVQCNVRDIGKRKLLEDKKAMELEAKETMLRELQHRVKNSLSIITGLISLEANRLNRTDDYSIKEILHGIHNRIQSIAKMYDLLNISRKVKEVQLDQYIEKMAGSLFESYSDKLKKTDLKLKLDKIQIDADTAVSLGLILNELLTNSFKYAFQDGSSGTVRVDLNSRDEKVNIEISDDGTGIPAGITFENSKGLGMTLVNMLSKQINGSVENIHVEKGTLFRIQFPKSGTVFSS